LSYYLVSFDLVEVDHGGRLSAMGGVGPLVIVEGSPSANARLRFARRPLKRKIDALILQRPPEAHDEDVV